MEKTLRNRISRFVIITAAAISFRAAPAFAQTEWTAATANWFTTADWSIAVPSSTEDAYIANGGTAQITATAGTKFSPQPAAVQNLYLGESYSAGSPQSGALAVSGTGSLTAKSINIGLSASGSLTQSAGLVSITGASPSDLSTNDSLCIGIGISNARQPLPTPSLGSYTLSGGRLAVTELEAIGDSGVGTFTQTGGDNNCSSAVTLGREPNGDGTYNMSGGTLEGEILMGDINYQNVRGTFNLSGTGAINAPNELVTGTIAASPSVFIQSGGSNTVSGVGLTIGLTPGFVPAGRGFGEYIPPGYGVYSISAGTLLDSGPLNVGGNYGTFTSTGGTSTVAAVNNAGSLIIGLGINTTGNLTVTGNYNQTAGITQIDGTLSVAGPNGITLTGGALQGSGSITANITNTSGTVAPGDFPGQLSITGNYTQGASGALNILIAGPAAASQFDVLNLTGSATLAGTLDLTFTPGFDPSFGDTFTFLTTGGNDTGQFDTLVSNIQVQLNYSPTGVSVTVIPEPASATLTAFAATAFLTNRPRRQRPLRQSR